MRREHACAAPGWTRQTDSRARTISFRDLGRRVLLRVSALRHEHEPDASPMENLISCTGVVSSCGKWKFLEI